MRQLVGVVLTAIGTSSHSSVKTQASTSTQSHERSHHCSLSEANREDLGKHGNAASNQFCATVSTAHTRTMAESTSRVSRKKRRRDAKRATDAAFREAAVERAVKQSLTARPDAALFTLDKRGDDASREPKRRRSAASRQSAAVTVRTKRVSKSRPQAPSDLQVFDIWASAASSQRTPFVQAPALRISLTAAIIPCSTTTLTASYEQTGVEASHSG